MILPSSWVSQLSHFPRVFVCLVAMLLWIMSHWFAIINLWWGSFFKKLQGLLPSLEYRNSLLEDFSYLFSIQSICSKNQLFCYLVLF